MTIRLKLALALVALAIALAAGGLVWQRSFEYVLAQVTYVRAPRQSAVGRPIRVVVRGRWPGPGFTLRRAEVEVAGTDLIPRLTGRRRRTAAQGPGQEVEATLQLPELPSAQYALRAGDLGTLDLMIYRRGSAPVESRRAGHEGDVTEIQAPVLVRMGEPFRVVLDGAWDVYGCEVARVRAERVGFTYLASVSGTYDTNDQVLAEGQGLDFTAGLDLVIAETGRFDIRDARDGDPWLCFRVVADSPGEGEIAGPVMVESLSCPPSVRVGETLQLRIRASVPEGCMAETRSEREDQGVDVAVSGRYEANTQAVHTGTSTSSILVPVRTEKPGLLTVRVTDGTSVLASVVDVRPPG